MQKSLAILGARESGVGAAILAKKNGYEVFVSDYNKIEEKYKSVLSHYKIEFEEGKHSLHLLINASEVIKSPGIPDNNPLIVELKEKNIPVISEIEFASRFTKAKKICITGSNGKTTTATWTYHILKNAGCNVGLAGNVGKSYAWQVAEHEFDAYVLEISSFQLDGMFEFRADIAVIMNITPDHLDRYDNDFQKYVDSKFRIIQNQTANDAFVYCADDPVIMSEIKKRIIKPSMYPFSIKKTLKGEGASLENNIIKINIKQEELNMTLEQLALQGKHNLYNSMAAGIGCRLSEIRKELVKESLSNFHGIEHRLEFVSKVRGVDFINDSKATNVNSTWYALESINRKAIWIVGGVDKGNDYSQLHDLVKTKVKAIVCLGVDNDLIIENFSNLVNELVLSNSMDDAVEKAYYLSEPGDVVLLSPACASFDLFENYEDRGNKFKRAVCDL